MLCAGVTPSVNHYVQVQVHAGVISSVTVRMYPMLCAGVAPKIYSVLLLIERSKYTESDVVVKTYFYTCFNIKIHKLQSYM